MERCIFYHDEHSELIEPYDKDGLYHFIPVIVFYSAGFHTLSTWVERPVRATAVIDEEMLKLCCLWEEYKAEWRAEFLCEIAELVQSKVR